MHIRRWAKKHFKIILKTKTSPHSLALGFALGTFLAVLPTPAISILLAIFLLIFIRSASKYTTFIALGIFNPFVTTPLYVVSFKIGDALFGSEPVIRYNFVFLNELMQFSRRFLVGNLLLAFSIALASYLTVFLVATLIQKAKKDKPV